MVNAEACQWHVDPNDKITVIIYFGEFSQGEFCIGPPLNLRVPVGNFDTVTVPSSSIFHKALPFSGERFSLSVYSKTTTEVTQKGRLICDSEALWALCK